MELNEYQEQAMTTCMPESKNYCYMMLNLVGEVGEFASKVAKAIRKDIAQIGNNYDDDKDIAKNELCAVDQINGWGCELEKGLMDEAGDILWQLSGLCDVMGWSLEEIAQRNLDKLASRKKRNVIDGDGDNR